MSASLVPQRPNILMCSPEYYGIEYEINPWMDRRRASDHGLAVAQWEALRKLLEELGAVIWRLAAVPGLPDLVFTANAALIHQGTAILSRFAHPQRQGEEEHYRKWFAERGFQVRQLPAGCFFEGAGDALFCGETLWAGYRIRSTISGHQQVWQSLGCRVLPLELTDPYYYHLDTCFCPLTPSSAIYYPPAFDAYARKVLEGAIEDLIPLGDEEARRFAANAVVLGRTVVTNDGCPRLHSQLRRRGLTPYETPLSEFLKAGGSAKCLTLRLDGEDAAAWKSAPSSQHSPPGG